MIVTSIIIYKLTSYFRLFDEEGEGFIRCDRFRVSLPATIYSCSSITWIICLILISHLVCSSFSRKWMMT